METLPVLASIDLGNLNCTKCPNLCSTRRHVLNGKGYIPASIMAVVEGPSIQDDKSGVVMMGPAGADYRRVLASAGIKDEQIFTTYLTRCIAIDVAKKTTRMPTDEEMDNCSQWMVDEVKTVQPNVLIAFGPKVASKLLGYTVEFNSVRGIAKWSEKYQCNVITTYSPDYLHVKPEAESILVQDLKRALKVSATKGPLPAYEGNYIIADTPEKLEHVLDRLDTVEQFSFDIETNSLNFVTGKVMCVSFSWQKGTAVLIPIRKYHSVEEKYTELVDRKVRKKKGQEPTIKKVPVEKIRLIESYEPYWGNQQTRLIDRLQKLFATDVPKIAQNGKFDCKFLKKDLGITVENFYFDTMLAHYMLDENMGGLHGLKECAIMYTDMGNYDEELEKWFTDHKITDSKKNYAAVPTEILYKYACMDADCTWQLYEIFHPMLVAEDLEQVFRRLIMPLSKSLQETEYRGVRIDRDYLEVLGKELQTESDRLHAEMITEIGPSILATMKANHKKHEDINFGSSKQLAELLFTHLKLPVLKRSEKGLHAPSTDDEVLQELAKLGKIPNLIVQYRSVNKLLSTYVNGLRDAVDADGFVHASFLIHTTTTGRLSSQDPNLQNIPKDDKRIKNLFMPRIGKVFIEADYSQAEFRHWANYSQDPQIIKDLWDGLDIHRFMAAQAAGHNVLGVPDLALIPDDVVTKDMRQSAKRIVFGLMNGMGIDKLAKQEKCTKEHAAKIIRLFFGRYPIAKEWLDGTIDTAKTYGQIRNVFGRTRRLPGANCYNAFIRSESERQAKNSPIQSAASDMNCNAANRINNKFKELGIEANLCVLVHDALLYEVPEDRVDECRKIIVEEMKRPIQGVNVPMDVEVKIGPRWGEVKEVKHGN